MGSLIRPIAGETIAIGTVYNGIIPDDDEIQLSDFVGGSITYTEIDGWLTKGAYGDSRQEISEALISRQRLATTGGTTDGGNMQNVFLNLREDAGQIACKAAVLTNNDYRIRVKSNDAPSARSSTVTITIATPGVISWTGHGLSDGDQVKFSTTGALPTGLTAGTTYYVVSATTDDFSVATTSGGTAIDTTGTQSGVHTATTVPTPTYEYFFARITSFNYPGGDANTSDRVQITKRVNSAIVTVESTGA